MSSNFQMIEATWRNERMSRDSMEFLRRCKDAGYMPEIVLVRYGTYLSTYIAYIPQEIIDLDEVKSARQGLSIRRGHVTELVSPKHDAYGWAICVHEEHADDWLIELALPADKFKAEYIAAKGLSDD